MILTKQQFLIIIKEYYFFKSKNEKEQNQLLHTGLLKTFASDELVFQIDISTFNKKDNKDIKDNKENKEDNKTFLVLTGSINIFKCEIKVNKEVLVTI